MARRTQAVALLALAALLAVALVGCSASTTTPQTESGSASGGQALVEQKCTMCHPIDRVNEVKKDQAGWEETIGRMEQNGLVVTAEERQAILDYLVQRDAGN